MTITLIRDIDLDLPTTVAMEVRAIAPPARTAGVGEDRLPFDVVEEWGMASFPASDPPANW